MRLRFVVASLVAGVFVVAGASVAQPQGGPAATGDAALIASAMSAAPKSVGDGATIVAMGKDGKLRTLRAGTNGFTCMPKDPAMPNSDPMCMDANALEWANAWLTKATPPDKTGFMYMLAGDSGASNTDPYATGATASNHWIKTGSHVMIVGSAAKTMGYPATPDPDVTKPYVMWAGTPYAHLMIPVR